MPEYTHIRIQTETKSNFDEVKDDLNKTQDDTLTALLEEYGEQ